MGFDIFGTAPVNAKGEYFRNNVWWWRPLQCLIELTCADILSDQELNELGLNDGYAYSAAQATAIGERLEAVARDEQILERYHQEVLASLSETYHQCWSRENVLAFAEFAKQSGGFEVC